MLAYHHAKFHADHHHHHHRRRDICYQTDRNKDRKNYSRLNINDNDNNNLFVFLCVSGFA